MPLLSKDAILAAEDLPVEEVEVPEWGGTVRVRGMSGAERDNYEESCTQERPVLGADGKPVRGQKEMVTNLANVRAKLVARTVVGENGERLFTDQDAGALGAKSASALTRVFEVAARLSRLSDQDVEELAGNSAAAPGGDSASSSPNGSGA